MCPNITTLFFYAKPKRGKKKLELYKTVKLAAAAFILFSDKALNYSLIAQIVVSWENLSGVFLCCVPSSEEWRKDPKAAMVSLRKRRLLNCCGPTSFITPLPFLTSEEYTTGVRNPDAEVYKNRGPIEGTLPPIEYPEENSKIKEVFYPPIPRPLAVKVEPVSSNDSGSFSLKELQHISAFSVTDPPNQEPCSMRGVYFKNMEWVAAIEVDKKQIHLGTFSSREEAARLYDRAAFLCGKEPNFELSEEEKRELRTQSWDEFLADKNTEKSIHMGSMETSTSEPKAERGESSSS